MADVGWQEYAVVQGDLVTAVPKHDGPLSHGLSLLGVAGLTAYHGLINVAGIHAGETLLVSANTVPWDRSLDKLVGLKVSLLVLPEAMRSVAGLRMNSALTPASTTKAPNNCPRSTASCRNQRRRCLLR